MRSFQRAAEPLSFVPMCTFVILRRPGHDWPVIVASNRDEMLDRPWNAPARHWKDRAEVIAGQDQLAGGTWLGMNDHGVVAAILNRRGSLGPQEGFRSRGELPLEALDHVDAAAAAEALAEINPEAYRPFNMVVADNKDAFWIKVSETHWGVHAQVSPIPEGLSMVTASDRNDTSSARIRSYLPQFERAPVPDPESGDWSGWTNLLTARIYDSVEGPKGAMLIVSDSGFGTVSSSLIALPAIENQGVMPKYLFAGGRPDEVGYQPVSLS